MKQSKINKVKALHNKVINAVDHKNGYTDAEYLQEDKEIKKLNDSLLGLVCEKCFPFSGLVSRKPKTALRSAATYDITYPKINEVIWNGQK